MIDSLKPILVLTILIGSLKLMLEPKSSDWLDDTDVRAKESDRLAETDFCTNDSD